MTYKRYKYKIRVPTGNEDWPELINEQRSPATDLTDARIRYVDAMSALQYPEARRQLTIAMGIIATIPNGQMGGVSSQTWRAADIEKALAALNQLEASADSQSGGGPVIYDVEYSGVRGGRRC